MKSAFSQAHSLASRQQEIQSAAENPEQPFSATNVFSHRFPQIRTDRTEVLHLLMSGRLLFRILPLHMRTSTGCRSLPLICGDLCNSVGKLSSSNGARWACYRSIWVVWG